MMSGARWCQFEVRSSLSKHSCYELTHKHSVNLVEASPGALDSSQFLQTFACQKLSQKSVPLWHLLWSSFSLSKERDR